MLDSRDLFIEHSVLLSTEFFYRELGGDSSLPSLVQPMSVPQYGVGRAKRSIYGTAENDEGV